MARGRRKPTDPACDLSHDVVALARRFPDRALERIAGPSDLEDWPEDAVAALVASVPADHAVSQWSASKPVSLWKVARAIAAPYPRDWADDLLVALAAVGSRLEAPWAATSTDLLGAPFHLHHRHTTAEQLAWIDPAALTLPELLLLAKHPHADARIAGGVDAELVHRWHADPELTDEDVARAARGRAPGARSHTTADVQRSPGEVPAPLVAGVRALLDGDDDDVRATLERTTHEVVFHRLLHIPGLDERRRIEVLVRVATLGFGWQRAVAWRRLAARSDVTEGDLARAVHGVRGDDFAEVITERRLSAEALCVLWQKLPGYQHRVVKHPRAPRDLCEARSDFALDAALGASHDEAWLVEMGARLRGTSTFMAIVRNPRCPPELVAEVADDPVAYVRSCAALHPRADRETLSRLASDPDVGIRELVAENASTPTDLLASMASDESASVRAWVANHASTPVAVLETLAEDAHARVRRTATSVIAAARMAEGQSPAAELEGAGVRLRRQVAGRTHLGIDVQAQLARDAHVSVRLALAGSLGLARDTVEVLASDRNARVRHAVAVAAKTPPDVRARLGGDARRAVAEAARFGR